MRTKRAGVKEQDIWRGKGYVSIDRSPFYPWHHRHRRISTAVNDYKKNKEIHEYSERRMCTDIRSTESEYVQNTARRAEENEAANGTARINFE